MTSDAKKAPQWVQPTDSVGGCSEKRKKIIQCRHFPPSSSLVAAARLWAASCRQKASDGDGPGGLFIIFFRSSLSPTLSVPCTHRVAILTSLVTASERRNEAAYMATREVGIYLAFKATMEFHNALRVLIFIMLCDLLAVIAFATRFIDICLGGTSHKCNMRTSIFHV